MATPVVSVERSTIANDNTATGVTSLLVPGTSVVAMVLGNQAAVAPTVSSMLLPAMTLLQYTSQSPRRPALLLFPPVYIVYNPLCCGMIHFAVGHINLL